MSFETLQIGQGIYTVSDLSEILKIKKSSARYWFNSYVRDILPSITGYRYNFESDKGLFVNFKSLMQFHVFIELKNRGHKKKEIVSMYKFIAKQYSTNYPFATKEILSVGSSLLIDINEQLVSPTMQYSMNEILTDYIDRIEFDLEGNAIRYYPMGRQHSVVVDPEVQFGSPVIKGTRIDTKTISELYESGDSKELIANIYDLSIEQVSDAISFSIAA